MDKLRFFAELHRLETVPGHDSSSFYWAEISVAETPAGWRVAEFIVHPEDLLCMSLFGHQSWRHDAPATAAIMVGAKLGSQGWMPEAVAYEGRLAYVKVRRSGEVKTARLVRTIEGSWVLLSVT